MLAMETNVQIGADSRRYVQADARTVALHHARAANPENSPQYRAKVKLDFCYAMESLRESLDSLEETFGAF